MATGGEFKADGGQLPHRTAGSQATAIAVELGELVDRMEAELEKKGAFSVRSATDLHQLRLKVERLFRRGGFLAGIIVAVMSGMGTLRQSVCLVCEQIG